MMKHVRFRVHVSIHDGRIIMPDNVVERLLCSNRISGWRAGVDAGRILDKVRAACALMVERKGPFEKLDKVSGDMTEELLARFDVGSIELSDQEFGLLCDLVEHAGDASAFDERYKDARFDAVDLRIHAPTLVDLRTPLVCAEPPPEIPKRADNPDRSNADG